jgi:hypothetical protein
LLDAAVYGLDHGSLISASPFDHLLHTIAGHLLYFSKPLALIMFMDVADKWVLDFSLF